MNFALRVESVGGGWQWIVKAEDGSVFFQADTEEECREWIRNFFK